mmetsp:Transcript_15253/g.44652  ORF Transcript_15253/g.44652 Transcript_15253/m.44652 type:complete len:257 (-) Transcript_15253:122-892(-)
MHRATRWIASAARARWASRRRCRRARTNESRSPGPGTSGAPGTWSGPLPLPHCLPNAKASAPSGPRGAVRAAVAPASHKAARKPPSGRAAGHAGAGLGGPGPARMPERCTRLAGFSAASVRAVASSKARLSRRRMTCTSIAWTRKAARTFSRLPSAAAAEMAAAAIAAYSLTRFRCHGSQPFLGKLSPMSVPSSTIRSPQLLKSARMSSAVDPMVVLLMAFKASSARDARHSSRSAHSPATRCATAGLTSPASAAS